MRCEEGSFGLFCILDLVSLAYFIHQFIFVVMIGIFINIYRLIFIKIVCFDCLDYCHQKVKILASTMGRRQAPSSKTLSFV